jgi:hypothetical protein
MEGKIKIIHKDCEASFAKNKSLPLNSYLVSYNHKNRVMYDIAQGNRVSIFDHYYDEYRNVISINWTDGRVNPKLYNSQPQKKSKK